MSSPGFYKSTVLFDSTTTSTSYVFTSALFSTEKNKICVFINNRPGAGITSAQYKFQQSLTESASGVWYNLPIDNIGTAAVSADTPPEFYVDAQPWTQNFSSTSNSALGPFECTVGMPWFRVAFKATGAGTLTTTITATLILL